MNVVAPKPKLAPLLITCTSEDCENGLHCYHLTKQMKLKGDDGKCRYCGLELVDWDRTRKCDFSDVDYTFKAMNTELWRHSYWHVDFDDKALQYAIKYGRIKLADRARKRIASAVGKPGIDNSWDGRQTPREGNPLYYAQHATATCCRKCIEQWHGIPQDVQLNDKQINYFAEIIMRYIDIRLPDLDDNGHTKSREGTGR
jgi:hypothetical protein